jgi:hypothetical protein
MHFLTEHFRVKLQASKKNCNKLSEAKEVGKLKRYLLMNLSSREKNKEKYNTMRHNEREFSGKRELLVANIDH